MAEGEVNIEMDHFDEEADPEEDTEEDTDETDFIDINQKIIPPDTDSHIITVGTTNDTNNVIDRINTSGDERTADEFIISKRKEVLKEWEKWKDVDIDENAGEASKELLLQSSISRNKNGIIDGGMMYKKVKVLVREGDKTRLSTNQKYIKIINEFDELAQRAKDGNLRGTVDNPTTSQEAMNDVIPRPISMISDRIEEREENLREQARDIHITEREVREFSGALHPKRTNEVKIIALEVLVDKYRLEELRETDPVKEQFYRSVKETAELKADSIRIEIGERPIHREGVSILENEVRNNDLNRLERFKRWAKKNMAGLSAIAITIAGIVTTIVVATRNAVSWGARAVGGFTKALANLGKSLGPLLAPLFSLVAQALTWGAKGIAWLANNLWVLAIAMTWLLYDYWKNRK